MRRAHGGRLVALAAGLAAGLAACLATPARPAPATPVENEQARLGIVRQAREYEDHADYAKAVAAWRRLRPLAPADADLELATALDEARAGQLDSAAVRLRGSVLSAAAVDTLPHSRYRTYGVDRENIYVNAGFDGWHWYVWRARAEVALARGHWEEAAVAARHCAQARPFTGKEWLLLAVCAGRAGLDDEARAASRRALQLDATLPEAHYLAGLWAWRDGRRPDAWAHFRAAVEIDSTYGPPALALMRSRLPGTRPDSLPATFLTGRRSVAMLISSRGPKLEDVAPSGSFPVLVRVEQPSLPDSLRAKLPAKKILMWLLVDEGGRVVLNDLQSVATHDPVAIAELVKKLPDWRFLPARVDDQPRAAWVDVQYGFPPPDATPGAAGRR